MKRFTLTMTMALGCLMTTQSFGFDLLDRMLGSRGCGCDTISCVTPANDCCTTGPTCGAEFGCTTGCEPACGAESRFGLLSKVGCNSNSGCCEADPCCDASPCSVGNGIGRGGLLTKLFSKRTSACCDSGCEPACGFESACAPACGLTASSCGCATTGCDSPCGTSLKPRGLLSKLFGKCNTSNCCDAPCDGIASGCGCGAPVAPHSVPTIDSVPEAPAPIADPSASYQGKRRVVQASARFVR